MSLHLWNQYFDEKCSVGVSVNDLFCVYKAGSPISPVCIVLVHGGGHTALSWALVAKAMKEKYFIVAPDLRGHGMTEAEGDLSCQQMSQDVLEIVRKVCPHKPIILVGHSMGGAVAIRACGSASRADHIMGLVVLDVVEGTALGSLPVMPIILSRRPKRFDSISDAIQWTLETKQVSNPLSAEVSVPSQLKFDKSSQSYLWRTDLMKTQPFWEEWYIGMSKAFVEAPMAKLLILAGRDRLERETELTIAQMQGKFQVKLVQGTGHTIQEDSPEEVANVISEFIERNRFPHFFAMRK